MFLKLEIFNGLSISMEAGKYINPHKLAISNINATRYQNGDISLHFKCGDALTLAHEKTGWLPIENGQDNLWKGFLFALFTYQRKLHKLISLTDMSKNKIVHCSVFCISHQKTDHKLRLRLFNDRTDLTCPQLIEIENISTFNFNLGSYHLEFDDVESFQKCYQQTGWETDAEKHFRVYIPESNTRSTDQSLISAFRDGAEVLYNNFELIPK